MPDTAGISRALAMMAVWLVGPPRSVRMPATFWTRAWPCPRGQILRHEYYGLADVLQIERSHAEKVSENASSHVFHIGGALPEIRVRQGFEERLDFSGLEDHRIFRRGSLAEQFLYAAGEHGIIEHETLGGEDRGFFLSECGGAFRLEVQKLLPGCRQSLTETHDRRFGRFVSGRPWHLGLRGEREGDGAVDPGGSHAIARREGNAAECSGTGGAGRCLLQIHEFLLRKP
jgi:hypothetical protein